VADGATVSLYYENRIPELQLINEDLNEDMERLLEEAELDESQEKKLEREFAREYHLISRDPGWRQSPKTWWTTSPEIELSDSDREKVKSTARELLDTLKAGKLVLDWRKRQQARAEVRVTIEKMLDMGLPRAYTPELFDQKTSDVFQHVYDAYYGAGHSVYAMA